MIKIMPGSITLRIVLLILMILFANVLLTWIFSVQYTKKIQMKETVQGIRAIVSDLQANENLSGIADLIEEYDIIQRKTPPENLIPADFIMLRNLSDRFNETNVAKIDFYNTPSDPLYIWMHYDHPIHAFDMWLGIPKNAFVEGAPLIAFSQEFIIVVLVVLGSLIVARSIQKPLRDIGIAARQFGSGEIPEYLKETGPEEVVQVAQSFNRMLDDFKKIQQERELMLAGISHDLRTPLTRLSLTVDLTREIDERTRQDLKADIEQITAMQQQFIDYISSGKIEALSTVNVNDLISQTLARFEQGNHEPICFEATQENIMAQIAPLSVSRVISNLIINALKYGEPPIKVLLSQNEKNIIISVQDHGKGVPPDQVEEIFRPLYRGDTARRNAQGSGLGLAIVERIVKKHNGSINLHQDDKIFEIKITLPR